MTKPDSDQLAAEALEVVLQTLLREHPTAFVAAINPDGLYVPMPSSVPLTQQRVLRVGSGLDLATLADRDIVLTSWDEARATGASRAEVHLRVDPDRVAVMHYIDVRPRHGVYVAVILGADGDDALAGLADTPPMPPRIARVRKNQTAIFIEVDEATTEILGWAAGEMVGHRSLDFVHPDDQERAVQSWMQMLRTPEVNLTVRLRHRRADGGWTWFEVTNHNLLGDSEQGCVLADMIDISDEMAAQEALRAREQLLHRLAEALPIGVFQVASDRRITYANERLQGVLGIVPATTVDEQLTTVSQDDRTVLDAALDAVLHAGIDGDVEVRVHPPGGARWRRCMMRLRALNDAQGGVSGAIVCVEDVTESAHLRAELERRATHDTLTGIMNRACVMAALEAALSRKVVDTAVIYIDLDRFKAVNDDLGHAAGDELLRIVADRLVATVRAGDALGRVGGDEFMVVCRGVSSLAVAREVAERVAGALCRSARLGSADVEVRASIGVAHAGRGRVSADTLVHRADTAMYASKRRGDGRPAAYTPALARRQQRSDRRGRVPSGTSG